MAMGNVDEQKMKIEEDAQKIQSAELVKQFKIEMGLASPSSAGASAAPEKTIGGKEPQRT
jgi:phage shock protein A